VVAPGLVPTRPGDRVKTDPRDARRLARLLAGGLLEPIWVPSPELEAARDLVRAREDARLDRMRDRHRLSKFCLRHGRRLPWASWGVARRKWLSEQRFAFAAQQQTFDTYLHALDLVDHRIEALERSIRETAEHGPWRELVARLRCLRGVDTLTGLAIAVEIGDFSRFGSAEEFMALVGLVPSEHSSGERRSQGSITKVGNAHVRRLLVEAAWHARRRPRVGRELARRQRGQEALVVERAWRCQQRPLPTLAADGRPRQAAPEDRRRLRPRAGRLRLGDRDRATAQERLSEGSSSGCARPHGEPSAVLCGARSGRPATLERGSSRRFPVMRSRPANVSLIHRRYPGPSAARDQGVTHPSEPDPLTFCSMSDPIWALPASLASSVFARPTKTVLPVETT
jgi:transposase